jgi:hypothetical protein
MTLRLYRILSFSKDETLSNPPLGLLRGPLRNFRDQMEDIKIL